jgi:hypothetical protein
LPFEEARDYVRSLGLKSIEEWKKWCKSGKKPEFIPSNPNIPYEKEWTSYGDWLGTGYVATYNRKYMPFEEARKYVHSIGLKSYDEWIEYCKSGRRPIDIPGNPYRIYENEWKGLPDFLGYEETDWSVRRVKELLHDLIKSKIIYQWDEAVLYSFLLRKGLLNIQGRHEQFFKNLIEASHTDDGRKAIEEYANSDAEVPPDLSKLTPLSKEITQEQDEEIVSASSQELTSLTENAGPLDYGEIKTAEQILAQTNVLESINVDEEAMQFYIDYSIDELWKSAFRDSIFSSTRYIIQNSQLYAI